MNKEKILMIITHYIRVSEKTAEIIEKEAQKNLIETELKDGLVYLSMIRSGDDIKEQDTEAEKLLKTLKNRTSTIGQIISYKSLEIEKEKKTLNIIKITTNIDIYELRDRKRMVKDEELSLLLKDLIMVTSLYMREIMPLENIEKEIQEEKIKKAKILKRKLGTLQIYNNLNRDYGSVITKDNTIIFMPKNRKSELRLAGFLATIKETNEKIKKRIFFKAETQEKTETSENSENSENSEKNKNPKNDK